MLDQAQTFESPAASAASRLRAKVLVEVELVLTDGANLAGWVFIGRNERVQDLLNDPKPFFPLKQDNQEILLINKSVIAICKPLELGR
jgi:hypothetical protein